MRCNSVVREDIDSMARPFRGRRAGTGVRPGLYLQAFQLVKKSHLSAVALQAAARFQDQVDARHKKQADARHGTDHG